MKIMFLKHIAILCNIRELDHDLTKWAIQNLTSPTLSPLLLLQTSVFHILHYKYQKGYTPSFTFHAQNIPLISQIKPKKQNKTNKRTKTKNKNKKHTHT